MSGAEKERSTKLKVAMRKLGMRWKRRGKATPRDSEEDRGKSGRQFIKSAGIFRTETSRFKTLVLSALFSIPDHQVSHTSQNGSLHSRQSQSQPQCQPMQTPVNVLAKPQRHRGLSHWPMVALLGESGAACVTRFNTRYYKIMTRCHNFIRCQRKCESKREHIVEICSQ